jgi:cytoskeletal protein CcmA (bactofilin family)
MNKMQSAKRGNDVSPDSSKAIPKHVSYLGPTINLTGELKGGDDILVEGQFKGIINIEGHNLIVGRQGLIEADVFVKDIIIKGRIKGNISASGKITIEKDGQVIGDISASRVSIMDGAQFKGIVKMTSS